MEEYVQTGTVLLCAAELGNEPPWTHRLPQNGSARATSQLLPCSLPESSFCWFSCSLFYHLLRNFIYYILAFMLLVLFTTLL